MPLSPVTEFLLAQSRVGGGRLATPDLDYLRVTLPPNTGVAFDSYPVQGKYMLYAFRFLVDASVLPGAFRFQVFEAGARPFTGTVLAGATILHIDYFYRIFWGSPVRLEITNLTPLIQVFSGYSQFIDVDNEEDWKELERRMKSYYLAGV